MTYTITTDRGNARSCKGFGKPRAETGQALGDELKHADEELLHAIRNVAVEHEVRRCTIMTELQLLAANVGLLPSPPKLLAAVESAARDSSKFAVRHDDLPTMRQDWQHAAASFEEQLHSHLNGRTHEAAIVQPAWAVDA